MKRKIYKLLSGAMPGVFALAASVFSGTAYSQATYTINYTGAVQTLTLPAGNYEIETWGADGGDITAVSSGGGGKGGYSKGTISVMSTGSLNLLVGGKGVSAQGTTGSPGAGGWNGGGGGGRCGKSGAGGGGATDVRVGGLAAGNRIIVAGGGGGAAYYNALAAGGHGGASVAQSGEIITSGNVVTIGGGGAGANGNSPGLSPNNVTSTDGTATGGGGGGNSPGIGAGQPGTGGGAGGAAGGSGSGSTGSSGGGGGGWAGGAGGTQTANVGAAGGGGSGYIGGVTNAITTMSGQTGYMINPNTSGNGLIIIKELCSISLYAANNTNSLNPVLCSGQSATLMTNAISNYSWSTGATTSSLVVSPTTNTVYTLSATSPSNCTAISSISITVSSGLPVLSISNPSNNICLGRTVSLTASGALSYSWTGGVVNSQTFTPNSTNVYTVTGQNGCGISTATTAITVSPLQVSTLATPTLVCEGYPSTLTAVSSVGGYTWQPNNAQGGTIVVAPMASTIYTVLASDGICSGTATLAVTTKQTPTISAAVSTSVICEGDMVTLTASGAGSGGSYAWTPGGSGPSISASPTISTLYSVSGTNSLNCTAFAQQVVLVNQAPAISVTANKNLVCSGSPAVLTAAGAATYNWNNGPQAATYTVFPTTAQVYSVTGTGTNSCSRSGTIAIGVVIPNVTVPSSVAVCSGNSATVTASGATTYSWNGFNLGVPSYVTLPSTNTFVVLSANTVSGTVNCVTQHTTNVIVNPTPTITAVATRTSICRKESTTLTAGGATSYNWGSLGTTATVVISPTVTGVHAVTGTDANGCQGSANIMIRVNNCTGLNEFGDVAFYTVYPNPSTGNFVIKSDEDLSGQIINTLGQVVHTFVINANTSHQVQITNLQDGVYYIISEKNGKSLTEKIVISKH